MDEKTVELIAIGAAYAANCEACLIYHIRQASQAGVTVEEVRHALDVGGVVKNAANARTEDLIERLLGRATKGPI